MRGRPVIKERKKVKDQVITMRVSSEQNDFLNKAKIIVERHLKIPVTKTWIIFRLCELGMKHFVKEYSLKKKEPQGE